MDRAISYKNRYLSIYLILFTLCAFFYLPDFVYSQSTSLSFNPSQVTLTKGGSAVSVGVNGTNLRLVKGACVILNGQVANDVTARLDPNWRTTKRITLSAAENAAVSSEYRLCLLGQDNKRLLTASSAQLRVEVVAKKDVQLTAPVAPAGQVSPVSGSSIPPAATATSVVGGQALTISEEQSSGQGDQSADTESSSSSAADESTGSSSDPNSPPPPPGSGSQHQNESSSSSEPLSEAESQAGQSQNPDDQSPSPDQNQ